MEIEGRRISKKQKEDPGEREENNKRGSKHDEEERYGEKQNRTKERCEVEEG